MVTGAIKQRLCDDSIHSVFRRMPRWIKEIENVRQNTQQYYPKLQNTHLAVLKTKP